LAPFVRIETFQWVAAEKNDKKSSRLYSAWPSRKSALSIRPVGIRIARLLIFAKEMFQKMTRTFPAIDLVFHRAALIAVAPGFRAIASSKRVLQRARWTARESRPFHPEPVIP
jgi:hypothetical protein